MQALPNGVQTIVRAVADLCGASVDDARMLHEHSNAAIALPAARLLVRIAGSPEAFDRIRQSVEVTRWLAQRDFPCVKPHDLLPFRVEDRIVSVWQLLDAVEEPPGTGAELGRILRALHGQPAPPLELRRLTDPLASVASAIEQHPDGMTPQDRSWLTNRIDELRSAWATLTPPLSPGLIHGDAHSNNLIRLRSGDIVLGDWDHVAHGPREWDLIQPHYMRRHFNRHSEQELREFTDTYGWDVRSWDEFPTLIQVREITGLSPYIRKAPGQDWAREEVAHRVATLRDEDSAALWNPPPNSGIQTKVVAPQ
ncbi:phosphotransferase enzyme family protein [Actinomadura physcomitrii]|nr:aminoglycoside phosphotransferase family protein [Actinomadura physcomitrii]